MLRIKPRGSDSCVEVDAYAVARSALLRDHASHGYSEVAVPFSADAVDAWARQHTPHEPELLLKVVEVRSGLSWTSSRTVRTMSTVSKQPMAEPWSTRPSALVQR